MVDINKKALVLFSGGQDSATCLFWALKHFDIIETVGFDYGQRHRIELDARQSFLKQFKNDFSKYAHKIGDDKIFTFDLCQQIGETSLTSDTEIYMMENGLPSTFVPARNLLFFSIAGGYGWRRGIFDFIGGMCETDYSGYPDCRNHTLKAMQDALSGGLAKECVIHTPLMYLTKAQTWQMIYDFGGDKAIQLCINHTHTCYIGARDVKHEWGYGCGECPACLLRKKGFEEFKCFLQA
jgi:7-cyano-7-deazaguanine synthase